MIIVKGTVAGFADQQPPQTDTNEDALVLLLGLHDAAKEHPNQVKEVLPPCH